MFRLTTVRVCLRATLVFVVIFLCVSRATAWVIVEDGVRRPILLHGEGDVSSADLPDQIRSALRVDAVARTIEWQGDRGRLRAAADERMVILNGRKIFLPRPIRMAESDVFFPEEILRRLQDIFSFVEPASGEDDVLNVNRPPIAEPEPDLRDIAPSPESPSVPPDRPGAPARAVRTVVIDPGHGGGDPGAKGKSGAIEKDIVLAIGIETARAIRDRDPSIKIILTRSRDEFITLHERARIANTAKVDCFISIHANSVRRNSDAGGFEVYHLDVEGANDDARSVAAFENSESQSAQSSHPAGSGLAATDLQKILGDVMQLQYINASLELSQNISDGLSASLEGAAKSRGSKGAFFYVLKDVMAPAVLIEVGFVTNDWEASFLQKPWYQRKIAAGIVDGVLRFKQAEEARLPPQSGGE